MWGQGYHLRNNLTRLGIIPTRVGTSVSVFLPVCILQDHPHACGDKLRAEKAHLKRWGSSPRVWGQVCFARSLLPFVRIIPTRVGTSILIDEIGTILKDHPHACGDKQKIYTTVCSGLGSSPRVWGQDGIFVLLCRFVRIIPTRVGTSVLLL